MTQPYDLTPPTTERSIGEIVTDIWEKTEALVRQEMRLGISEAEEKITAIKVELEDKVQVLKLELYAKAVGALCVFAGLLAVIAGIVLLLAMAMNPWLAAVLVGAAFCIGGILLLKREVKLPELPTPADLLPTHMIESTKQDLRAIKEATHDPAK